MDMDTQESVVSKVRLEVMDGPMTGREYIVHEGSMVNIGRSIEADFSLPDDRMISRTPARITFEDGVCFIEDAEQRNKIWIDGKLITQKTPLRFGEVFVIGGTSIKTTLIAKELPLVSPPKQKPVEPTVRQNIPVDEATEGTDELFRQFVLDIEDFTILLVHSLLTRTDASVVLTLPSHPLRLKQLLKNGTEEEIAKYLKDLKNWLISVITGYEKAVPEWFDSLWKKIDPQIMERDVKAKKKLLGLTEAELWNQYKKAVQDMHPELTQDEVREKTAKIAKKWFKDLNQG